MAKGKGKPRAAAKVAASAIATPAEVASSRAVRSRRRAENQQELSTTEQNTTKRKAVEDANQAAAPHKRGKTSPAAGDEDARPEGSSTKPSVSAAGPAARGASLQVVVRSPSKLDRRVAPTSVPLQPMWEGGDQEKRLNTGSPYPKSTATTPTRAAGSSLRLPMSNPFQAPPAASALVPQPSAADKAASIMQSILQPGSSKEPSTSTMPAKAVLVTKKPRQGNQPPAVHYNPLTLSKRQEINNKVSDFYNSLREFAQSSGLNPAAVTRYALGGELKGGKMNCWKCFQLLSGMARNGLVVWDDALSKFIGQDAPKRRASGSGKDAGIHKVDNEDSEDDDDNNDNDDDDEDDDNDDNDDEAAEPNVPAGELALSGDIDFEYDPRDPAGLRLGKLSADDGARYHLIKSACMKAGQLEEWKQSLNHTVVELSSTLSTQTLTNARSKKAAKRILQELQQYAMRVYGLFGISVSGIILGANLVAPSTALHPTFFGPEPKFVNLLQNMLWDPQDVQQYLLSTALSLYSNHQRKVDTQVQQPVIPQSSMPALGVPSLEGSVSRTTLPRPGVTHAPSTCKPPRPTSNRHSRKASEPSTTIDDKLLDAFCNTKPFSLKAAELVHAVVEGESDLLKIPRRRQITLLYKVFQHCWLRSLQPFHKGKKASVPRFSVNPKSVASLGSDSPDYLRCRLEGYPLKMRYPESASELQQWCPWEATAYQVDDDVTLEVADISETLVFQLVSAFLRGSEYLGDTIMLEFQGYEYPRKQKKHLVERAVVVDVSDRPVVWGTGDIVPYPTRIASHPIPKSIETWHGSDEEEDEEVIIPDEVDLSAVEIEKVI